MKRILLVRPISRYYYTLAPNLGLGYLASALRKAGHEVAILDCDKEGMDLGGFDRYIQKSGLDIVGFQLYTNCIYSARDQIGIVKSRMRDALVLVGGPHASGDPIHTLQFFKDADMAVLGEGEEAVVKISGLDKGELCDDAILGGIDNIAFRDKNGGIRVNDIKRMENLDDIAMSAWDLIDPRTYPQAPHGTFAKAFPTAPIITSRGCPYRCTFCASFATHGRKIRRRSPSEILNEIKFLKEKYGVREFHIEDDNFTLGKDYAKDVLSRIVSQDLNIWISLPNGVRIDALDEELLKLLERAGCYSFGIGIESGSDRILKLLKKDLDTNEIAEKVGLVKRLTGIRITGFFLMGHPEETEDDIMKSIELALRLKIDRVSFSPLMPLPGSELYEEWKDRINLKDVDLSKFLYYQFIPGFSPIDIKRLEKLLKEANLRFYLRAHILFGLLTEISAPYQLKVLFNRAKKILTN